MIRDGALHPVVSLLIIVLSLMFIVVTASQVLSNRRLCVDYPGTSEQLFCIGQEPTPAPSYPFLLKQG